MRIGKQNFPIGERTYIMGILNLTPDSFSDGGSYSTVESAVAQAHALHLDGADIIDIGGESTRPGHETVTEEEEIRRILPVILGVKKALPEVPISIDTYKPAVFFAAIDAGADMLNDIWGLRLDPEMARLVARHNLPCCLMHNQNGTVYPDFLSDVKRTLEESLTIAKQNGIPSENIILDPGIGFGKNYTHNLTMLRHLEKLKEWFPDHPVLLGTSRKSFIGKALGDVPPTKREIGTVATTVLGIQKGCDFVRVHQVALNRDACRMADAIVRG